MRAMMVLLGVLAAAGAAVAPGTGGFQGGGSGTDLSPVSPHCVCYNYGTGYGVWFDESGNFNLHQDYNENAGHYTPAVGPGEPEVGFDLNSGRWSDAWGNVAEGRAEVRTNGGGWVNTPGPSEGGLANQGFGLGDLRLRADRQYGAHAEFHNGVGGSLVGEDAHVCLQADPQNLPGSAGANVNHFLHHPVPGVPLGAYAGNCWFEPGPGM